MSIRKYGWTRDLPDHRDHVFSAPRKFLGMLPPSVDLRAGCPEVYDQKNLGSCTANAIGAAHQFEQIKQGLSNAFNPSRLFIYFNEREMEGTINQDDGAQIRDGMKTVAQLGVCPEVEWQYDTSKFAVRPTSQCYLDALKYQVVSYQSVNQTLADMKGCLAAGYPFVMGFSVYESFESQNVANTGNAPMPGKDESQMGGHAVLAVGYDDATQRFLIRNSWGVGWGQCFSGDTKISLLNGTEVRIDDLTNKTQNGEIFWVYSYNHKENKIVPRMAKANMTGIRSDTLEVTLDNNEKVVCTKDHKWMLINGEYKEAKDLRPGDSLMPLYRKNDKVLSVRELNIEMPVYDLTVEGDDCHNFALSAGVFVHNCGYFTLPYEYLTNEDLASDFWTIRLVEDSAGPVPEVIPWYKKIFPFLFW